MHQLQFRKQLDTHGRTPDRLLPRDAGIILHPNPQFLMLYIQPINLLQTYREHQGSLSEAEALQLAYAQSLSGVYIRHHALALSD